LHLLDRYCQIKDGDDVKSNIFDYLLLPYVGNLQQFVDQCQPDCDIRMVDFVIDMLTICSYRISHADLVRNNFGRYGLPSVLSTNDFNRVQSIFDGDYIR